MLEPHPRHRRLREEGVLRYRLAPVREPPVLGFVWTVVALLQLLTAFLIARRITAGKALGLIGASLSMLTWFFSIRAHPTASVLIIVLDGLILYALTAEPSYDGPIPSDARIEGMAPGQQGQRFA
jgi:hypothetical protein